MENKCPCEGKGYFWVSDGIGYHVTFCQCLTEEERRERSKKRLAILRKRIEEAEMVMGIHEKQAVYSM